MSRCNDRRPTPLESTDAFLSAVTALVDEVRDASAGAVGIGIPSAIDQRAGRAVFSVNIPLADLDVRAWAEEIRVREVAKLAKGMNDAEREALDRATRGVVNKLLHRPMTQMRELVVGKKRTGGRNNVGWLAIRHRGGGHKKAYRIIDFRRDKKDVPGKAWAKAIAAFEEVEGREKAWARAVAALALFRPDGRLNEHLQVMPVVTLAPDGLSAKARWRAIALEGDFGRDAFWGEGPYENAYVKDGGVWKIKTLHWYQALYVPYDGGWQTNPDPTRGLVQRGS